MNITPIKTRIFHEGEPLLDFLVKYLPRLKEKAVVVVTSKIVALAERRTAKFTTERAKTKLIKQESDWAVRTRYCWLTLRDGAVMPSAGIDESNGQGKLILLPRDAFQSAKTLWLALRRHYKLKQLGVLITESRTMPLRAGTIALALGYAGFYGIRDYRGKRDLFGRKFEYSRVNVADSLATAAVLTMGEGNERQPLAVIQGALVVFTNRVNKRESFISLQDDMFRPLFTRLLRKQ
ncbi:MAG: coenzyme F420-0:L-glutamate ligase [Candidatus Veblenbacteria bacterium]|nr:coenzyme F420-0:L-glutamate ligase [Candidatus Veblenbacteria bacterium]